MIITSEYMKDEDNVHVIPQLYTRDNEGPIKRLKMINRCIYIFQTDTPFWVAGISGHGMFSLPLRSSGPIFEAEFLASLYGIYSHLPFSNNVYLIGDNTGVLYSLQKGGSRNLISNYFFAEFS